MDCDFHFNTEMLDSFQIKNEQSFCHFKSPDHNTAHQMMQWFNNNATENWSTTTIYLGFQVSWIHSRHFQNSHLSLIMNLGPKPEGGRREEMNVFNKKTPKLGRGKEGIIKFNTELHFVIKYTAMSLGALAGSGYIQWIIWYCCLQRSGEIVFKILKKHFFFKTKVTIHLLFKGDLRQWWLFTHLYFFTWFFFFLVLRYIIKLIWFLYIYKFTWLNKIKWNLVIHIELW